MKKLFYCIGALAITFILVSGIVLAADGKSVAPQDFFTDGFRCVKNDDAGNTYTIVEYSANVYTNIIPGEIQGYKITRIGDGAFKNKPYIVGRIDIPDSVISIGKDAFSGCSNIRGIYCGSGLVEIGDNAFSNCKELKEIHLSNVKSIGTEAFSECPGLSEEFEIPQSVNSLGDRVFSLSNVKNVKFVSITAPKITINTFDGNPGLKVSVPEIGKGYTKENYWPVDTDYYVVSGDLDRNGQVDTADAAVALNLFKYKNYTSEDIKIGDMDKNGIIDTADAAVILNVFKYGSN